MFCKNCGAPLNEGTRFCPSCGAAQGEASPSQQVSGTYQAPMSGSAPAPQAAPRKRKFGWVIALLLIAAAAAAVVLNWGRIQALINRTAASPEDYYHRLELKNVSDSTVPLAKPSGLMAACTDLFQKDNDKAVAGKIALVPGQPLLTLLYDNIGMDFSWFKNIGLTYTVDATHSGMPGGKASLQLNDTDVVGLDAVYDKNTSTVYIRVPDFSDDYMVMDVDDVMPQSSGNPLFSVLSSVVSGDSDGIMAALPDGDTLAALINRYAAIVVNDLENVERASADITASGVSCTYTTLTVTADKAVLEKVLRDVMQQAKDDQDIKNIIQAISAQTGSDADEAYAEFQDSIKDLLEQEVLIDAEEVNLKMVVYVDDKDEIRGRDLQLTSGEEAIVLKCITAIKGTDFGTDLFLDLDGTTLTGTGSGTIRGDYSKGSIDLQMSEGGSTRGLCTVSFDGEEKDGIFHGEITFTPARELLDEILGTADLPEQIADLLNGISLTIVDDGSGDHASGRLILRSGSSDLLTLSVESDPASPLSLSIPGSAKDSDEWAEDIGSTALMTLLGNLQQAGVPSSLFASILGG